jgi:hypothetical protein
VKRAVCGCGHKFRAKRKATRYTVESECEKVKRRKAVECEEEIKQKRESERVRKAKEPLNHVQRVQKDESKTEHAWPV